MQAAGSVTESLVIAQEAITFGSSQFRVGGAVTLAPSAAAARDGAPDGSITCRITRPPSVHTMRPHASQRSDSPIARGVGVVTKCMCARPAGTGSKSTNAGTTGKSGGGPPGGSIYVRPPVPAFYEGILKLESDKGI